MISLYPIYIAEIIGLYKEKDQLYYGLEIIKFNNRKKDSYEVAHKNFYLLEEDYQYFKDKIKDENWCYQIYNTFNNNYIIKHMDIYY